MVKGNISRRDFISMLGAGSAAFLLNAYRPLGQEALWQQIREPDIELSIRAVPGQVQILDGPMTNVWRYEGEVVKGPADALVDIPGSYLGPTIHARKGQTVRVNFTNQIPEPSIIHWHGLHVPESADGHPRLVIDPDESYVYDFTVMDRAGTYWYHPHPHGRTGTQVMNGLAGLFIISDNEDDGLALPGGAYDIPLVIQDRSFDQDNQFVYDLQAVSYTGFYGERILVNGLSDREIAAATHPYRLRVLNGSNARIYTLRWRDGSPLTVIGTDGGLLAEPVERDYLVLSPGERVDLWADFSHYSVGEQLQLVSRDPGRDEDDDLRLIAFNVEQEVSSELELPEKLSVLGLRDVKQAVNLDDPRQFILSMGMHMQWFINNKTFEMNTVDENETVKLGDLEVWDFTNQAQGMGRLPHPMHIHGVQFQVVERVSEPEYQQANKLINQGQVDSGWKDTVLVMPGERVRVLLKFEDYEGLYLYHCHNLEHEDMGMMRNYRVISG